MARINDTSQIVEKILRAHPEARDDDFLLYAWVLNHYGHSKNISFWYVRELVVNKSIPSMESVGRCRRKLQEMYEELRAIKPVEEGRRRKEPEYKQYARDHR